MELPCLVLRGVAGREVHGQDLVGLMFQTALSIRTDTHLPASCGEVAAGISSARQVVRYLCQSHSSAPLCLFKHTVCSFSEQRITFSPDSSIVLFHFMILHTFSGMFCLLSPLKSCYSCSFEHWLHCILFPWLKYPASWQKNLFYVIFCLFKQGSSEFSGSFRRLSPAYQAQKSYTSLTQIMFK